MAETADPPRYVVITLSDAQTIATALRYLVDGNAPAAELDRARANLTRIVERLRHETGANVQEVVDDLAALDFCSPCAIEGKERSCQILPAQKLGRRLRRLLERARGARPTPDTEP